MQNEILFFFSALGVFNSSCLAIYFLIKSKPPSTQLLLGAFLLFISLRTGISCIYFFEKSISPLFVQIGLLSNLLAGISLYLLVDSATTISNNQSKHLIGVLLILLVGSIVYPMSAHVEMWDHRIRFVIHGIVSIYLILSWSLMYRQWQKQKSKDQFQIKFLILLAFTLVCLSFAISLFTNYILGPILYSFIFYVFVYLIYSAKRKRDTPKEKYSQKKIKASEAQDLLIKINQHLKATQLYKRPNLKVKELADEIGIPAHQLSQVLNDNLGLNFTAFINQKRIEEAKKLLKTNDLLTIEAIGYEVGFKAKTTFFKNFKSETGLTPNAFRKM